MRPLHRVLLAAAATAVAAPGLIAALPADRHRPPAQVFDRSAGAGTIAEKLDRALAEAAKSAAGRSFWIGYAIDRLMGEDSHIGSFHDGWGDREPSIAAILAGKNAPEGTEPAAGDLKRTASAALDRLERKGQPEKKVIKELGFFLKYGPGKTVVLAEAGMSTLDLSFDFEGAPLFWLGKAPEKESLGLIEALYGRNRGEDLREHLIAAAGCHGSPKLVLPFLTRVLGGDDPDELRKGAAFWIGQQNDPEGLRLLAKAARTDRSREVREGDVFGISKVELPAAVDEIIALAKGAEARDVRKQAVFWLSQMASKGPGGTLEEIAVGDADLEIQEQAVFALSQLPGDEGLDALIRLAKTHRDARIRKRAVFWLGESEDPRALEALIAIVKGK